MTQVAQLTQTDLETQGQNSIWLVQDALSSIAGYTQDSWNDHHSSDPGITILEALAWNIAELSRRLSLPVPDLLATDPNNDTENAITPYYLGKDILPGNPVTQADHRRHMLDIPGIQQAWLHQDTATQETHLYIDLDENQPDAESDIRQLCAEVRQRFIRERNVNQDLDKVVIITKHDISIKLELILNKVNDLITTLTDILQRLQLALAPEVSTQSIDELVRQGVSGDQILDGPWLEQGLITAEALAQVGKPDWIYSSQLLNILSDIPELTQVAAITLSDQDNQTDDPWRLKVKKGHRPRLNINETLNNLTLKIEGQIHPLTDEDKRKIRIRLATQDTISAETDEASVLTDYLQTKSQQLHHYGSIQRLFPTLYQVAESRLNREIVAEDAAIMQLKGYLTLFDQILADQYAQLDNLKTAFALPHSTAIAEIGAFYDRMLASESFSPTDSARFWRTVSQLPVTRRSQPITDIAGLQYLLGAHDAHYQQDAFQPIAEPPFHAGQLDRLRRSLSHLLARFAEQTPDTNLLQYKPVIHNYVAVLQPAYEKFKAAHSRIHDLPETVYEDTTEFADKLVTLKEISDLARILNNYPDLSRYRCGGYNYLLPPGATAGRTGLTQRILTFLGSTPQRQMPLATGNREGIYLLEAGLLRPLPGTEDWDTEHLYFVIPDWPTRFANTQFQTLLKAQIRQHSPVHQQTSLIRLARREFSLFERLYYAWLNALNQRPLHIERDQQPLPEPAGAEVQLRQIAAHLRNFIRAPARLTDQILQSQTELALQTEINTQLPDTVQLSGYDDNKVQPIPDQQLRQLQTDLNQLLNTYQAELNGLTMPDLLFAVSHEQIAAMANPAAIGEAYISQNFVIGYAPLDRYHPGYPISTATIHPQTPDQPTFSIGIQTPHQIP